MKKILLATGIFYPDIGGPAIHARRIADEIVKRGAQVRIIAYGGTLPAGTVTLPYQVIRIPCALLAPIRWLFYTIVVFYHALWADTVYAFDLSAAGVPAALAVTLTGKRFFIRIGGDPIWERVVERGKRFIPLNEYYVRGYYRVDHPFLFHLIRFVLSRADAVIICLEMFSDFYARYFNVSTEHISVIPNPLPVIPYKSKTLPPSPLILYAGRFVAYKNLPLVLRVFTRVHAAHPESRLMLIGGGPEFETVLKSVKELNLGNAARILPAVPHEQLEQFQREASIALAPALTEFNPNFALESLSFGIPVLISRGNGLTVRLPEECLFDPTNEDEMFERWNALLDPQVYARVAAESVQAIPNHTWADVTAAHARLLGV